jgi:hypothetical protein
MNIDVPEPRPFCYQISDPQVIMVHVSAIEENPLINDLPEELLELILKQVWNHEPIQLLPSLVCCKLWHRIGGWILYQNISIIFNLTANTEAPRIIPHAPALLRFTETLTLNIHNDTEEDTSVDDQIFADIRHLLPQLKNLTTFSLLMRDEYSRRSNRKRDDGYKDAGNERLYEMIKVVQHLPSTLTSLEIDFSNPLYFPDYRSRGKVHLCSAIQSVVPHLHNLRVRCYTICGTIIQPLLKPSPTAPHPIRTLLLHALKGSKKSKCHPKSIAFGQQEDFRLPEALRSSYINGNLPFLQRAVLICDFANGRAPMGDPLPGYFNAFVSSDIVEDRRDKGSIFCERRCRSPGPFPISTQYGLAEARCQRDADDIVTTTTRSYWLEKEDGTRIPPRIADGREIVEPYMAVKDPLGKLKLSTNALGEELFDKDAPRGIFDSRYTVTRGADILTTRVRGIENGLDSFAFRQSSQRFKSS